MGTSSESAEASIEGTWRKGSIAGTILSWNNGKQSKIDMVTPKEFTVTLGEEIFTAVLRDDGKLHWSDDDVWEKQAEYSSHNAGQIVEQPTIERIPSEAEYSNINVGQIVKQPTIDRIPPFDFRTSETEYSSQNVGQLVEQPTIDRILSDARLLLNFMEFAKNEGRYDMAASAHRAAVLQGAKGREFVDELKLIKTSLSDLFHEYWATPYEQVAFDGLATSYSENVQDRLRSYAIVSGRRIDSEHEMYAFAMSLIRGMRTSMEMQERCEVAMTPPENLDNFLSSPPNVRKCSSESAGTASREKSLLSKFVRRFEIDDVLDDGRVTFEDAAPSVFHRLRTLADVSHEQYRHSLLREDMELISFGTNSKSGEFFFFSHDGLFMVKTISDKSAQKLMDMLPSYEEYLEENEDSFLVRYLGLHRVKLSQARSGRIPERWFVVMKNAFYTSLEMHAKYDLKGSHWGRKAKAGDGDRGAPLLDLDWKESRFFPLSFSQVDRTAILEQYEKDSDFLQSKKLVDYSILMGIHDTQHESTPSASFFASPSISSTNSSPSRKSLKKMFSVQLEKDQLEKDDASDGPSLGRACSRGGHQIPGGIESNDGAQIVVFCLIDTLEQYDFPRQLQHRVGDLATGVASLFTRTPCQQAIVDPDSYRKRQLAFFRESIGA